MNILFIHHQVNPIIFPSMNPFHGGNYFAVAQRLVQYL